MELRGQRGFYLAQRPTPDGGVNCDLPPRLTRVSAPCRSVLLKEGGSSSARWRAPGPCGLHLWGFGSTTAALASLASGIECNPKTKTRARPCGKGRNRFASFRHLLVRNPTLPTATFSAYVADNAR